MYQEGHSKAWSRTLGSFRRQKLNPYIFACKKLKCSPKCSAARWKKYSRICTISKWPRFFMSSSSVEEAPAFSLAAGKWTFARERLRRHRKPLWFRREVKYPSPGLELHLNNEHCRWSELLSTNSWTKLGMTPVICSFKAIILAQHRTAEKFLLSFFRAIPLTEGVSVLQISADCFKLQQLIAFWGVLVHRSRSRTCGELTFDKFFCRIDTAFYHFRRYPALFLWFLSVWISLLFISKLLFHLNWDAWKPWAIDRKDLTRCTKNLFLWKFVSIAYVPHLFPRQCPFRHFSMCYGIQNELHYWVKN